MSSTFISLMINKHIEDYKLVKAVLKGNIDKFDVLYKKYRRDFYLICKRYARLEKDSDDFLQESLIQIYTQLNNFDPSKGNFLTWAKRVVINVCLMQLRKNKPLNFWDEIDDTNHSIGIMPKAFDSLSLEELTSIIQQLPKGFRTVFNMYVIDGFSHKEIADKLGISVGTSKSQLQRARKQLQRKILPFSNKMMVKYG